MFKNDTDCLQFKFKDDKSKRLFNKKIMKNLECKTCFISTHAIARATADKREWNVICDKKIISFASAILHIKI